MRVIVISTQVTPPQRRRAVRISQGIQLIINDNGFWLSPETIILFGLALITATQQAISEYFYVKIQ